ncbi:hypothetical protein PF010_g24288 [Phytophthora fragariae]|uniref:Secreted protein n=1 Tax=Phytophthora fragariae TaxID=53985 RepID=A0A6G0K3Q2_9STRA|nr:hypothetical protein PF010_g24288 [Phytophthora fragariae]
MCSCVLAFTVLRVWRHVQLCFGFHCTDGRCAHTGHEAAPSIQLLDGSWRNSALLAGPNGATS